MYNYDIHRLVKAMQHQDLQETPLLVLANKQDRQVLLMFHVSTSLCGLLGCSTTDPVRSHIGYQLSYYWW